MSPYMELIPAEGSTKDRKRLGRGNASGQGRQSGRGHKGWHSRSGSKRLPWYEGGQMPLQRRVPKRGFSNARFKSEVQIVSLATIAGLNLEKVDPVVLRERGVIKHDQAAVKVLGDGELASPVEITASGFSKSAKAKIEQAGGKAISL